MFVVRDGVLSKALIAVEHCRDAPTTDDDHSPQAQLKDQISVPNRTLNAELDVQFVYGLLRRRKDPSVGRNRLLLDDKAHARHVVDLPEVPTNVSEHGHWIQAALGVTVSSRHKTHTVFPDRTLIVSAATAPSA